MHSYVDVHAGEGEGGEEGGVGDVDQALPREGQARRLGQVLRGGQAQAAKSWQGGGGVFPSVNWILRQKYTDMSKGRSIGCVIPSYKFQWGITQPILQLF